MDRLLLGIAAPLAALAISSSPAAAQPLVDPAIASAASVELVGTFATDHHGSRDRHDGPRHRRSRGVIVWAGPAVSEGWAEYNNRSWQPDSFNDWWHDRPERAFPRWMQNNQDCQRLWWGGGGWRC